MSLLRIAAFMDGRPGHEKQTRAVLEALENRVAVAVQIINLPPRSLVGSLWNWLSYAKLSDRSDFTLGTNGNVLAPDLILGTGSRTHLPMLNYRGRIKVKVVCCMSPDFFLRSQFDLCLIPRHDRPTSAANVFATTGPPCAAAQPVAQPRKSLLVLVGGIDPKSHAWSLEVLMRQITKIARDNAQRGITISSSPRTPPETEQWLERFARETDGAAFFASRDTAAGWVEQMYATHKMAWVTADSVSMIYEALTAGCPVGVLPVKWKRRDSKHQRGIDDLVAGHKVFIFDDSRSAEFKSIPTLLAGSEPLNEAARCAEEILKRWWPDLLK